MGQYNWMDDFSGGDRPFHGLYLLSMVALPPSPTPPSNEPKLAIAKGPVALPVPATTVVDYGSQDSWTFKTLSVANATRGLQRQP